MTSTGTHGQLQAVGRGASGNLYTVWCDPVTGLWHVANQVVAVGD